MFRKLTRRLFGEFSLGILVVEFISIIIAIFLGNLATDWNQNRAQKREAREARISMCEELDQNYRNLKPYQVYYHRMLFLLDSLEAIDRFEALFEMEEFHNINPPLTFTFAYDMAKGTGKLANIDHRQAITFYTVYAHLQGLKETIELTQSQLFSGGIEEAHQWRTTFNFYRESVDLFFRDYPLLQQAAVCPGMDQTSF